jgi:hypothetical protein
MQAEFHRVSESVADLSCNVTCCFTKSIDPQEGAELKMKNLANDHKRSLSRWASTAVLFLLVFGLLSFVPSLSAQSGAGSIQGTVADTTGAVLPGAAIHVVNQDTNVATDAQSNSVGFYQVPALFTGHYTLTVSASNMKIFKTSVELQVAQNVVINPVLVPGAVTQQIEVAADVVQLTTTDNGTIASTLESSRISQLPMNGRLLTTLTGMTTPGLEVSGTRANGLMGEALEYVADGVPLSDRQFGGEKNTISQIPDPDSVQEVRVETTNTSAQYTEPGTAIITTKSGTNSLHGSLFETARNNAIGVAKVRQNPSNYAAPHLVRNEFGASAGGPVILPKLYHGKDKTFWFFAYERYSLAQATTTLTSVPTQAMRNGDFSGLITSGNVPLTLYDPATTGVTPNNCAATPKNPVNPYCRTPFPNNNLAGRLAPTTKLIYDILPLPTTNDNPLVTTNLQAVNPNYTVVPTFTVRLDHVFSENNRAYLRYSNNDQTSTALRNYPANEPATIAADGFPFGASGIQAVPALSHTGAIGYTHVFSPTFFSETIVSQQWEDYYALGGGSPNTDFEKMLGTPNNFGEVGFPYWGDNSGQISPLSGTQFGYGMDQIVSTIDENLTKTVGRHQMQFGGRYRHERFAYLPDEISDAIEFGAYASAVEDPSSGANYLALTNTGHTEADAYLGAASNYVVNEEPPYGHYHDMEFDAYFQDNYHVTRNLTVNLGLRYENHPAPWTKYGVTESFDLKNDAVVFPVPTSTLISEGYTTQTIINNLISDGAKIETAAQAGMPANTLLRNYPFTFGPRVGFAYQPFSGKYGTVLRGAYGRYIYPVPVRSTLKNIQQDSPFTAQYNQSYIAAAQSPDGLPNYLLRSKQSVIMGVNSTNVVNSSTPTSLLPGINLFSMNPTNPPDYVTQVNFTVEQPLKASSALRLSWLWTHGTNLDQEYDYNLHPSNYVWEMQTGTVSPTGGTSAIGTNQYATTATGPYDKVTWGSNSVWDQKSGWSNDNALQANYQHLYHNGSAYQIAYVWSKPFRVGGNYSRDSIIDPAADYVGPTGTVSTMTEAWGPAILPYLPPVAPQGIAPYAFWHDLDKYENYIVDTAIPKQHITFNGVYDLPFGRGKRFLSNANRFLNELAGGFQIAGDGSIISQDFTVTATNWGPANRLQVYKHGAPITDCRSGVCRKAYLWWNGYIAPSAISGNNCGTTTDLVSGLPYGYQPYQTPIDNDCVKTDAAYAHYGANEVNITLPGGSPTAVSYSPAPQGGNPFSHTVLNGPFNYVADFSVFKVFPITERFNLRLNADAFNVFNNQGWVNPSGSDGTEQLTSSYNNGRQIQLTLRLSF